jgi:hypothetical protein
MRLFLLLLLIPSICSGQIRVDKAGDGWDLKIDSALIVIKQTDLQKYQLLDSVCQEVSFWISNFSSNELVGKTGRIYVSTKDVKLGINNLACVLIHESLHLYFLRKGVKMTPAEEENYCYRYELEFIQKLTNPEPWLKENALKHIQ